MVRVTPVSGEHGYGEERGHRGPGGGEDAGVVRRGGEPEPLGPSPGVRRLLVVVDITVGGEGDGHRLEPPGGQGRGRAMAGGQWESVGEVGAVTIQARGAHTRGLGGVRPREREMSDTGIMWAVSSFVFWTKLIFSGQLGMLFMANMPQDPGPVPALENEKNI